MKFKYDKQMKKQAIERATILRKCGKTWNEISSDLKTIFPWLRDITAIRKNVETMNNFDKVETKIDESCLEDIAKAKADLLVNRKINVKVGNKLHKDANTIAWRQMVLDAINGIKRFEPVIILPPKKDYVKDSKSAVYIVSDEHYRGNEDYQHMIDIYGEIANDINRNKVSDAEIWLLGDGFDGLIHSSSLAINDGAIKPCIDYAKITCECINSIPQISKVVMVCKSNHTQTRPLSTKRNELPNEDLGFVIKSILEIGLHKHIEFISDGVVNFDYKGHSIVALHGHQSYAKSKAKMIEHWATEHKQIPDVIVMGHFHNLKITEMGINKWLVVAPAAKDWDGDYERENGFHSTNQLLKMQWDYDTPQFTILTIKGE